MSNLQLNYKFAIECRSSCVAATPFFIGLLDSEYNNFERLFVAEAYYILTLTILRQFFYGASDIFSKIINTFRFQVYKEQKEEIKRLRAKETKG